MTEDTRKRRRFWLKLAAGLLFAVVAYGGTYAVLVDRVMAVTFTRTVAGGVTVMKPVQRTTPFYPRLGPSLSNHVHWFFVPAHWIDRKLRPGTWQ